MKDKLSKFFSIFPWPDDPEAQKGKDYFDSTIKSIEKLFEHPWFTKLLKKKKVRILEICGGAGFGGVALSNLILQKNLDVDLVITDLRKDALKKAKQWGEKVLGKKILTKVIDAKEIHKLGRKFDMVFMYGLSTPHFNPWDIIRLFGATSECLEDDGIFIIDEADRRYSIFFTRGYQQLIAEGDDNKFVLNFHSGYDMLKGTFSRTHFSPIFPKKTITMELYFWGLAEIGSFTFLFFEDVDFVNTEGTRCFILGYKPRKVLRLGDLREPLLFRKYRQ